MLPPELTEIIFASLGIIITGLATWLSTVIVQWLNNKIADKKKVAMLTDITNIVITAVKATYQTYVESLKGTDAWTKEAQEKALNDALLTVKTQLSAEAHVFIQEHYGDVTEYLKNLIESILYDLKK